VTVLYQHRLIIFYFNILCSGIKEKQGSPQTAGHTSRRFLPCVCRVQTDSGRFLKIISNMSASRGLGLKSEEVRQVLAKTEMMNGRIMADAGDPTLKILKNPKRSVYFFNI
jgi:hypothetical protein